MDTKEDLRLSFLSLSLIHILSGYFAAFKTDSRTGTDAVAPEWKSAEQKEGNYIGTKAAILGENVLFAGDSGKLVLANAKRCV